MSRWRPSIGLNPRGPVGGEVGEYPTGFTYVSGSATNLAVPQGVAFNPGLTLFWGTDKTPGAGSTVRRIFEYDASYNLLRQSANFGPADGLPADVSQVNGITYWNGKLYAGYNNYPNVPKLGGIIVFDPTTLTIDAIHPAGNGHVEGCTIRDTARGVEVFVFSNTGTTIERYDLATWTKQGEHDFGNWAVDDPDAVYQGGGWFGDCMVLTLHGNQPRPQTIDVCRWDDTALEFTPLWRLEKPTAYCGQGLNFSGRTLAFLAERNIIPTPDEYRIVRANVASVVALPHATPNGASGQLADLEYWYRELAWNAGSTAWQLPDTQGNGSPGTIADETRVYPVVTPEGVRKIRFDGVDGSGIALGNLFGPTGWTSATIWMRGVVVHSGTSTEQLLSWDASGSNTGDGRIELNRLSARTITLWYNGNAVALTTPLPAFTHGEEFDLCVTLGPAGAQIYTVKNGVVTQVATTATTGQLGGANQACYLGSNLLLAAGAEFDVWDVRIYNAVKDPLVLATYDMWSD